MHKSHHGAVPPLQPLLPGSRGMAASSWVCRAGDAASSKVRTSSASARVCTAAERATWQAGCKQPVTNSPSPFPPAPSAAGPPPRPRTGRGAPMIQMQAANQALTFTISSRSFSSGSPSSPKNGSWCTNEPNASSQSSTRLHHFLPLLQQRVALLPQEWIVRFVHKAAALLLVVPAYARIGHRQVGTFKRQANTNWTFWPQDRRPPPGRTCNDRRNRQAGWRVQAGGRQAMQAAPMATTSRYSSGADAALPLRASPVAIKLPLVGLHFSHQRLIHLQCATRKHAVKKQRAHTNKT